MSETTLAGAAIGILGGLGLTLIALGLMRRQITLVERIAPYLRQKQVGSRLLLDGRPATWGVAGRIAAPLTRDLAVWLEKLGSSDASVAARLRQAGRTGGVEQFRLEQLAWAGGGLLIGLVVALAAAARGANLVLALLVVVIATLAGALGADYLLGVAATRRTSRILEELPDLAELLALAVGAGEAPLRAIERLSESSDGEVAREFRDVVTRVRTGEPFTRALEALAATTASPELARFSEAIVVATERGTPLAAVLRAQAGDLREAERARLMEVGGTKELGMMVPIVFLVLPITVIFALFPGLAVLRVGL